MNDAHSDSYKTPSHILCVDDHLDLSFMLQFALQREGYRVTVSQGVQQALEHLNSQTVDLLMTDLRGHENDEQRQQNLCVMHTLPLIESNIAGRSRCQDRLWAGRDQNRE